MNKIEAVFLAVISFAVIGLITLGFYMVFSNNSTTIELAKINHSCSK